MVFIFNQIHQNQRLTYFLIPPPPVIALLHTLLTHPKLVKKESGSHPARIISRVLLTVPVNTLENWKAEFSKWIVNLPKITLFDFSSTGKNGRELLVKRWAERGGVMIITYDTLARAVKNAKDNNFLRIFQNPGADGKKQ
jgi:SNF2 family DNA or RNA helicase